LNEAQKQEVRETGTTTLTLQQQVEHSTTLELWRFQLYSHGVEGYVKALGMAKCLRELKARKAEMTTWEQRRASRHEVEHALTNAIHNEVEKKEQEEGEA
jgi:hypothetical protein